MCFKKSGQEEFNSKQASLDRHVSFGRESADDVNKEKIASQRSSVTREAPIEDSLLPEPGSPGPHGLEGGGRMNNDHTATHVLGSGWTWSREPTRLWS